MRKSVQVGILVVSLAALLIVGGTMAWFTAEAQPVTNTFTAGTVKVAVENNFENVENWNPGDCVEGEISVEYTGSKKAYVRVAIETEWEGVNKEDDSYEENENPADYRLFVEPGSDESKWIDGGDGYLYYSDIVGPGDEDTVTIKLIDQVCLDGPTAGNAYQGKTFTLKVEAEAVQASNGAAGSQWDMEKPGGVEENSSANYFWGGPDA